MNKEGYFTTRFPQLGTYESLDFVTDLDKFFHCFMIYEIGNHEGYAFVPFSMTPAEMNSRNDNNLYTYTDFVDWRSEVHLDVEYWEIITRVKSGLATTIFNGELKDIIEDIISYGKAVLPSGFNDSKYKSKVKTAIMMCTSTGLRFEAETPKQLKRLDKWTKNHVFVRDESGKIFWANTAEGSDVHFDNLEIIEYKDLNIYDSVHGFYDGAGNRWEFDVEVFIDFALGMISKNLFF